MRIVESHIEIAVPSGKAILAFTDPILLKGWWGVEKSLIELKTGGIYTLAWAVSEQGIRYVSTGIVKEYDPSTILHIEKYIYLNTERPFLGPQELSINAQESNGGCRLQVTQGPYPETTGTDWDWYYDAVKEAWPGVLIGLKKFLEEKFPR
ncbi:MAG: SRPBCC domain-containing protein [Chitinophagaceae bacterium]|nr:SRPBCC domain-containing protein [Chitinophagaceae bacterium]